ncbi:hypothetical protein CSOJ01_00928 [Colletotrichum sojae]|uniref:Uncharacterized protein n=1 Tax=Colletotrichum sojae TaxID=2175907 RepID=A0A8H6JW21_9PEZI|nr:hypothetical protein CSOJ01_00928 [Colletotrichum sojae]
MPLVCSLGQPSQAKTIPPQTLPPSRPDATLKEGEECAVQTLYEGRARCTCCTNWVEEYPRDLRAAVEQKPEVKKKALVARMRKNHDGGEGGRPLVLDSVVVHSASLKETLAEVFQGYDGITPSSRRSSSARPSAPSTTAGSPSSISRSGRGARTWPPLLWTLFEPGGHRAGPQRVVSFIPSRSTRRDPEHRLSHSRIVVDAEMYLRATGDASKEVEPLQTLVTPKITVTDKVHGGGPLGKYKPQLGGTDPLGQMRDEDGAVRKHIKTEKLLADKTKESAPAPDDEQALLCHNHVRGYCLKSKSWAEFEKLILSFVDGQARSRTSTGGGEGKEHIWRHFVAASSGPDHELHDGDFQRLSLLPMNRREIKNVVKVAALLAFPGADYAGPGAEV